MLTEEIRINIAGHELAAKQWGDSDKPAIIALHGWLDNAATYDRLAPLLLDHRIIAMDFVGHGYSSHRPEGVRYHMLDNVDDVLALADALELDRFILMGHSMGAGIASLLSGAFPERIEKLILIEGLGTNTSDPSNAPKVLRTAVCDMKKASAKRKPIYESENEAIEARMQALGGISRDASHSLCGRGLDAVPGGFTWRSDPRLKMSSAVRLTDAMIESYLSALVMPVLLITGKQSFFAATDVLNKRANNISNLTHFELEGNHHLHLEPATFQPVADSIIRFLKA
jgi:pimeloyl-ACP methyl ester carboxylesterase